MTKCKLCKRPIKNQISIIRGYGGTCWKKHQNKFQSSLLDI